MSTGIENFIIYFKYIYWLLGDFLPKLIDWFVWKDLRLNSRLQNFMYTMLKDSHTVAAKTSLDVMIALYKVSFFLNLHNLTLTIIMACEKSSELRQ